jgi:hypothetical protein
MKKSLFLFMLVFRFTAFAQTKYSTVPEDFITFHDNISAAERMYKNDSLLQAYAKFDIAFEGYKGAVNPGHYFKAALCAIKIKEEFKALYFLEKAIINGYELDSANRKMISFYNQNTKKEFVENFPKWEDIRVAARNANWESELLTAHESNKKYNSSKYTVALEYCSACMKNKACNKTAPDFTSKYKLVKEKMTADSLSAAQLLNQTQQLGFPTVKLVGKKANEVAHSILLNYDADKKNERLDGFLTKALIDGNISPEFYALLVDRRNVTNGLLPEFYEPITGYEKTIGKEIAVVNKKRRTIGLYSIKLATSASPKSKDSNAKKVVYKGLYDY